MYMCIAAPQLPRYMSARLPMTWLTPARQTGHTPSQVTSHHSTVMVLLPSARPRAARYLVRWHPCKVLGLPWLGLALLAVRCLLYEAQNSSRPDAESSRCQHWLMNSQPLIASPSQVHAFQFTAHPSAPSHCTIACTQVVRGLRPAIGPLQRPSSQSFSHGGPIEYDPLSQARQAYCLLEPPRPHRTNARPILLPSLSSSLSRLKNQLPELPASHALGAIAHTRLRHGPSCDAARQSSVNSCLVPGCNRFIAQPHSQVHLEFSPRPTNAVWHRVCGPLLRRALSEPLTHDKSCPSKYSGT